MKELRENPSIKGSGYYTYCNEWIEGSTQYDDTPVSYTHLDVYKRQTVDGWPLGGGKVSGGRVKNHYPKALRLL